MCVCLQVIDPTYLQMVMQVPPEASLNNNVFVHDHFHTFTTSIFLGIEVCAWHARCRLFWASVTCGLEGG